MIWSEGDEEEEPPVFDRRMMEGQMAALTREMVGSRSLIRTWTRPSI